MTRKAEYNFKSIAVNDADRKNYFQVLIYVQTSPSVA